MSLDLPDELRKKLNLIEQEIDLRAHRPPRPSRFSLIGSIITLACLVIYYFFRPQGIDSFFFLFFLAINLRSIASYFEQRKVYRLYSSALEIIDFYKKQTGRV